ncbi:ATP-binding cassette domain-containing protein [Occultella gossypii]|uniref:ABC transporter ATP-binding protein n=1 Tax=Occultella gossypii TaxID=2800820 RepID=A0ABS7SH42_9MICO|nr:ABC transporter ATP-binding protein [Occultella gossypii]MBZ2199681.1 ABC transporter ATP-binding protein [Occultella gossypii]
MSLLGSLLRDLDARGWWTVALTWARTGFLAGLALTLGAVLDAIVGGRATMPDGAAPPRVLGLLVLALGLAAAAAACAGLAAAQPPIIQGEQEVAWRGRAVRAVLRGTPADGVEPVAPTGGAGPGRPATGAAVSRLTDAVERVAGYRASFLPPTLASFTAPIGVLVVIAVAVDLRIALVLGTLVALVPVVVAFFMRRFRRPNARYRRTAAAVAGRFHEMLRALGTLRLMGATGRGRDELAGASASLEREIGAMLRRSQLMIGVNDALFSLVMITAALGLALAGFAAGSLGLGDVLATFGLALLLHEPIDLMGRSFYIGMGGRAAQRDLEGLSGRTGPGRTREEQDGAVPAAARSGVSLTLRGLGADRAGAPVLRGLDVAVPAGGVLAVAGPTGAGKTTLAMVLQGLLPTAVGGIDLDGQPADTAQLRAQVRTVPQQPFLFTGTIAQNLRLARPDAGDDDLWHALTVAHLDGEVAALEGGLAHRIGEAGAGLSGGQIRRVGLARAFLADAPVLVLDEPTADLDRRTEALVTRSLRDLRGRRTLVLIAHRLATTAEADLVLVLADGRVVEVATPADLLARDGYYAAATAREDLAARP